MSLPQGARSNVGNGLIKPGNPATSHAAQVTKVQKKYNGTWTAQRYSPSAVREHLPALHNDLKSKQIKDEKNIVLDFDDMKNIRKRVSYPF